MRTSEKGVSAEWRIDAQIPSFDQFTEFSTSLSTFTKRSFSSSSSPSSSSSASVYVSLRRSTCSLNCTVHWNEPDRTNTQKKKKTKRSIGISSRANYPRRWPRRLLDFSHKFFDWSVNDGDDKISIPPSMSHFQLCAYVASGAVATPCVAFIDPADTRRRRSGKVWNIDARIKHPCNFSPLFLFFSFFLFFPSFFSSFKPDKSCEFWGKKWLVVAVVNF